MEFFDPVERSESEYKKSQLITESLKVLIKKQDMNLADYQPEAISSVISDRDKEVKLLRKLADYQPEAIASVISDISRDKEVKLLRKLADINSGISDDHFKRSITLSQEKGSGVWLNVLPIGSLGWMLNKEEFRDGIRLRYGWQIPNIPN